MGEGKGKVRPTLVAACAFSLADMQIALRKIEETKASLAIAYAAGKHTENRGPMIRALMNYAYVLRGSGKPRSTRAAYISALDIAKSENGPSHQTVEQIKYEYSSYLAKTGKLGEASQFLLGEADVLLAQAEKLDVEEPESEQGKKAGETESHKETETADPGSGLEHIQAEVEAQSDPSLSLKPGDQARHYVMRNLMNAAGLLDNKGDHETAETALTKAVEIAIRVHGENSVHHMNTLYAMGLHYRGRGALQDAIAAFETVLSIMDETIEVYEPELLQNRIAILRDAAVCYDEVGDPVTAVDYATGAVVNAQTLAKIMSANGAPRSAGDAMLEPFWMLLADLKTKAGDAEGAAEARREALRGKLNQGIASRGRSGGGMQRSGGSGLKRNSTGGATRAGGRRV